MKGGYKDRGIPKHLSASVFLKGVRKDKRESRALVGKVKKIQEENGNRA
jgi:hypothetical protein